MRIARIALGSHMPGFPIGGHICIEMRKFDLKVLLRTS